MLGACYLVVIFNIKGKREKGIKVFCKTPPKFELNKAPFGDDDLYEWRGLVNLMIGI